VFAHRGARAFARRTDPRQGAGRVHARGYGAGVELRAQQRLGHRRATRVAGTHHQDVDRRRSVRCADSPTHGRWRMPGPLEGIRVIELGMWVAGPAAGGILADWGADVVKIEPPTGDPARQFAQMIGSDVAINPAFEIDNRSKRSIALDLTSDDGHRIFLDLITGADAFVTNIRIDALEGLALDAPALLAHNPSLVYGIITGYGLEGEERDRAAYDLGAFWARAGIASVLTAPGSPPPFQRGGFGDHGVAMDLVAAINAALVARDRPGGSGRGQLVATSLLRHGMYTICFDLNTHL